MPSYCLSCSHEVREHEGGSCNHLMLDGGYHTDTICSCRNLVREKSDKLELRNMKWTPPSVNAQELYGVAEIQIPEGYELINEYWWPLNFRVPKVGEYFIPLTTFGKPIQVWRCENDRFNSPRIIVKKSLDKLSDPVVS